MTLLFDKSPEEPTRLAKRPRPAAVADAGATAVEVQAPRPLPQRAILPIGTIDHTYACPDERCQAECNDILHEDGRHWLIQCAFCGLARWVPVIKGHLKPREEGFVLRDGRFAGLTLPEVEQRPRGLDYLRWAAESHPRPMVREAAKKHLAAKQGSC